MNCSVNCPHGHTYCELVTLVQGEIEHAARDTQRSLAIHFHDEHGRPVNRCEKCNDSGWVHDPRYTCNINKPCSCPAGEQV